LPIILTLILPIAKLIGIVEYGDEPPVGHPVRVISHDHKSLDIVDLGEISALVTRRSVVQLESILVTPVGVSVIESIQQPCASLSHFLLFTFLDLLGGSEGGAQKENGEQDQTGSGHFSTDV